MTCEDIQTLKNIIKDIVITTIELETLEKGKNTDYTGVIDELKWNHMILENRVKTLKGESV